MMKTLKRIAQWMLPACALLLVGCVSSIHPLHLPQDVVFDPALLGTWRAPESKETWELTPGENDVYRILHTDEEGKRGALRGHLLVLDGRRFLDLYPAEAELPQSDFYRDRLLPTHTFVALSAAGEDAIDVSYLDPEWLKRHLAAQPDALRHERIGDEILITAAPGDLQRFLLAHLRTDGAFSEPGRLIRQPSR